MRVEIEGGVQGVGFRPFVYRLAERHALRGRVVNGNFGVRIDVEGERSTLDRFYEELQREKPAPASIHSIRRDWIEPVGFERFTIEASETTGDRRVPVLADIALCGECRSEIEDPTNRRHDYPFTNCTLCGPRFTIVRSLPYDRPRTTMERFEMCDACLAEYVDPSDRRFHAQPNACPVCGPRLAWWNAAGEQQSHDGSALAASVEALRSGAVVAVKGLGGFHLMVDAANGDAVRRLRRSKPRRAKPFAIMVADLDAAHGLCHLDAVAGELLGSPEAPIVLLPRRKSVAIDDDVAPDNPYLGVMLPYTPLHHLLTHAFGLPLVATSGNLSDEPICIDENEAIDRLDGIVDGFLVHDRPIARHVDDSVAWVVRDHPRLLRRARGYAPRPVLLDRPVPPILAVGAHFKNTIALSVGRQVFISQHIGDMQTPQALEAFERVVADFLELYGTAPLAVAHDLHPDYASTRWALTGLPDVEKIAVQHHHAHLASVLAENKVEDETLGVVWDGTGHGEDGIAWGGEFLLGDRAEFKRVAHLRPFRLPGGDAAAREPRRSALGLLWEWEGSSALDRHSLPTIRAFREAESATLGEMIDRGVHAPWTTSAGRLFDAVASLVGLNQKIDFEGQAAMQLEYAGGRTSPRPYPMQLIPGNPMILDWAPMLEALLHDLELGCDVECVSARFHAGLVAGILAVVQAVGCPRVALSGGCFQNRRLLVDTADGLEAAGMQPLLHHEVPPNDGGISLGQVAVAAARIERRG